MDLKGRLALIASKVQKANIVADIGTDHAYIPIYLVENGICKIAIASDVRKGPIKAALSNIKEAGLEDKIETRLGNGLETISENDADTIIIAGMGGILITNILTAGIKKAKSAMSLILQPMNRLNEVRKWLSENNFEIYDEELCAEGEKIYNVICARQTASVDTEKLSESTYLHVGKKLIEKNDPLLGKMLKNKIRQLDKAIREMKNASDTGDEAKRNEARNEYIGLRDDLKRIENMIE